MSQSCFPDLRVRVRGMGEEGERVGVVEVEGGGVKDTTSPTRMAFSGSKTVGRSKTPLRWDW